ncbi:MAG: response regulator [Acidobacteriota bacterium]|nr:response regulator [Acidobacteriota bacterium]MDH3785131.1 response regulator [Acidobacteriota bacterium]
MAQKTDPNRRFLTTSEVADYCAVSNDGVLKWIKSGKLLAFCTPGGHYRVLATEFRNFLAKFEMPVDESFFRGSAVPRTAMVVDDDADIRTLISRWLLEIQPDIVVEQAEDGYDAGIKAGELMPDLIIVDIMMPNVDGIQLCRSLRNHDATRNAGIMAITGGDTERVRRMMDAGADVCLMKPLDQDEFRDEARRLLGPRSQTRQEAPRRRSGS